MLSKEDLKNIKDLIRAELRAELKSELKPLKSDIAVLKTEMILVHERFDKIDEKFDKQDARIADLQDAVFGLHQYIDREFTVTAHQVERNTVDIKMLKARIKQ